MQGKILGQEAMNVSELTIVCTATASTYGMVKPTALSFATFLSLRLSPVSYSTSPASLKGGSNVRMGYTVATNEGLPSSRLASRYLNVTDGAVNFNSSFSIEFLPVDILSDRQRLSSSTKHGIRREI